MAGPTNRFDKLDHTAPLVEARVNRTGPGWDNPQMLVERSDGATNLHNDPVVLPPSEPAPVPPTEAELRERLRDALAAQAAADASVGTAQAAHARAEAHRETCNARLDGFAALDTDFADAVTEALRHDGRPGGEVADVFAERIAARTLAQTEARAADIACTRLLEELTAAAQVAEDAEMGVRRAEVAILALKATDLAYAHLVLQAQAAAIVETLHAFDRTVTTAKASVPAAVMAVLHQHGASGFGKHDAGQWREAAAALRTDPNAEVVISTEAATERRIHAAALATMPRVAMPTMARYLAPLQPEPRFEPSPPDPGLTPPAAESVG